MTHITSFPLRHDECAFLSLSLALHANKATRQGRSVTRNFFAFWQLQMTGILQAQHTTTSKFAPQWKQTLDYRALKKKGFDIDRTLLQSLKGES